jgi:hypothetical protein
VDEPQVPALLGQSNTKGSLTLWRGLLSSPEMLTGVLRKQKESFAKRNREKTENKTLVRK